ncbi:MAG: F0F1 ATP synthase subunit epsilon [Rhodospirillaceae bacterium]
MSDKVDFELVSPDELLMSQHVDMVVVPGSEGYFGVLAGHIPLITTVRPGAIQIYEDERVVDRIFVTGGFAEVAGDRCTVLVEGAIKVSKLDRAKVEQDIKNYSEDVEDAKTDDEREVAKFNLDVAQAQLQAIVEALSLH